MRNKNYILFIISLFILKITVAQSSIFEAGTISKQELTLLVTTDDRRYNKDTALFNWILKDKELIKRLDSILIHRATVRSSLPTKKLNYYCNIGLYERDSMITDIGTLYPEIQYFFSNNTKTFYEFDIKELNKLMMLVKPVNFIRFRTDDIYEARKMYNNIRSNDSVLLVQLQYGIPPWLEHECWGTFCLPNSSGVSIDSVQTYLKSKYNNGLFDLVIRGEDEQRVCFEIRTDKVMISKLRQDPFTWYVEKDSLSKYKTSFIIQYPVENKDMPIEKFISSNRRDAYKKIKQFYKKEKFDLTCVGRNSNALIFKLQSNNESFQYEFDLYEKGYFSYANYFVELNYWILK